MTQPRHDSNGTVASPVRVVIGVITFRRPSGLRRLLESLRVLEFRESGLPGVEVVVVDNDAERSGEAVCRDLRDFPWRVRYVSEARRGIPQARNAVLRVALEDADFLAFIDDDEAACPGWLDTLLAVQHRHEADVVGGPVLPVFVEPPPQWVVAGGFFNRARHPTGTAVTPNGTGNVLIRVDAVRLCAVMFDERFALTGGSDTLFLEEMARRGATVAWADEAVVWESIPTSRVSMVWLLRRAFRHGIVLGRIDGEFRVRYTSVLARLTKGLGQIAVGASLVLFSLCRQPLLTRGFQSVAKGVGGLVGLLGFRFNEYDTTHGE